ncbi:antibiotic biosynthesis monooxygenase family protein [Chloroflexota bacterium]
MIVGFGLFSFKEDSAQQAMALLLERLELEKKQKGILEGHVARGLDDPSTFFICTKWDSWESRQNMFKALTTSPESSRLSSEIMKLTDKEPIFGNLEVVE